MSRRIVLAFWLLASMAFPSAAVRAQGQPGATDLPEAVEAIDRARVTTRILCITAHPDDEPAGLLTYLARGLGADVALLSITRGEGGQNALGPEQGAQLAVLRSHELLAATRIYGIRLFFTRARDTGFVKTVETTQKIWGDTALADMVHVIRTFQPNIVINSWGGVHTGHGHHQTSGILTPQAVAAAADPKQFPGDLAPWKVDQVLERYRDEGDKGWAPPLDEISPLWGRTYAEIGREGDYQHRTQGIAGFLTGSGPRFRMNLIDEHGAAPDPARFAEPLTALAARYPDLSGARPALERAEQAIAEARRVALTMNWRAAARQLADAGGEIWKVGKSIADVPGHRVAAEQERRELRLILDRIDHALELVAAIHLDVQASRREAIPGETIRVSVSERHRQSAVNTLGPISLDLPDGWTAEQKSAEKVSGGVAQFVVHVPPSAPAPHGADDWMFPVPPPLVRAGAAAMIDGSEAGYGFLVSAAVTEVRASSTQVETLPLQIVPRVTLTLEPREMLVPPSRRGALLEVVARVHYYGSAPAQMEVQLDTPAVWPRSASVPLKFDGAGDQLARLQIPVPRDAGAATLTLQAAARLEGQEYRTSMEPLPTLPTRLWSEQAAVTVCIPDLTVPDHLRVGYVAAENDPIPEILREAGIAVDLLDPVALAFNDLSRYDAIAVGIRAYELRGDLARSNHRLLEYAAAGGTLVVQYSRSDDWNRLMPAPYPAKVGQPTLRVTDRNSPVRILAPQNPLLNFPNRIGPGDFDGWVQERGLYFWGEFDPRFTPILALRDPGEGELNGSLVVAPVGKGTYIYTGLSFFRQLPEGVQGPLRLFVNLLSQSRAPKALAAQ
ncbi:MAG TPA: PIG-L family deacetylase [Candidatus Acidoferrales bacterium]|nr:PIG-L family deacetylase [Candidatus Acidoferrales bacterium]